MPDEQDTAIMEGGGGGGGRGGEEEEGGGIGGGGGGRAETTTTTTTTTTTIKVENSNSHEKIFTLHLPPSPPPVNGAPPYVNGVREEGEEEEEEEEERGRETGAIFGYGNGEVDDFIETRNVSLFSSFISTSTYETVEEEEEEEEEEELYIPEEEEEGGGQEELYQEENPFNFDLQGAKFVLNSSELQIGPKFVYNTTSQGSTGFGAPLNHPQDSPHFPQAPGVHVSHSEPDIAKERAADDVTRLVNTDRSAHSLHISIHTPPVHPVPTYDPAQAPHTHTFPHAHAHAHAHSNIHSSLHQTQSAPGLSPTPLIPPLPRPGSRSAMPPVTPTPAQTPTRSITNLGMPPTPTATPTGTINISEGGNMVMGTQIVIHSACAKHSDTTTTDTTTTTTTSQEPTTTITTLSTLLAEVREKLSTVYIRQTKTSFLPWLKGHQVIPMTEFYTSSRIIAVDKQGRQTSRSVDLMDKLVNEEETRYLVEGEPGMGKTLLALKLAIDWANKTSLQEFKFVFLIFLRDFKGSLEQYVREELLPSHFQEKFRQVWDYCKENEGEVLFILDGYDELQKEDEGDIRKLLHKHQDFQNSKVVVTARPDVLKTIAERTVVKGFNEAQMVEFITKYFHLVNEDENGRCLKKIMEKDGKYRQLAERPLFCVLLCMLYGSVGASKLPDRLSDMMFKIMLCLIKWNIKKVDLRVEESMEAFPTEYERVFLNFGKLCLDALQTEKTRFSEKEIKEVENFDLLLHLGFLSNDSENNVLGHKKFWKPVHKIFLEYLAGLYIAHHIHSHHRGPCRQCREFSTVYRHEHVLKFVVGILGKNAHLALDYRRLQAPLQMRDQQLLMLLRETEATRDNCSAIAKLLDRRNAIVYTSDVDFEGWRYILAQNFKQLKSLEIVWRIKSSNPDQESSFNEASPDLYRDFFNALRSNSSITRLSIRAMQDGEPFSDAKIELFFSHLQRVLNKENLKELEIKELNMMASEPLRRALEGATCNMDRKALESLERLHLDMYLRDEDLEVICDRLKRCAGNLRELQLRGLEHGHAGFSSLVELLKKNKNLHTLCLSMNKEKLMYGSGGFMTPSDLHAEQVHMPRHAHRKSKDAFRQQQQQQPQEQEQRPSCPPAPLQYPTRELSYLFNDPLHTGAKHSVEARCYYFICGGGESRLPLPLCISSQHKSVFHMLFTAVAESSLHNLTLVDPYLYLTTADLVCLGDAIRRTKHLSMLKLSGLTAVHYMPILLGLGQSQSLKTVRLDSSCVTLTDRAFQLACTALRHNTALRSLSLAHWEFCLQDKGTAKQYLKDLLTSWRVEDLNLSNCTIDVSGGLSSSPPLLPPILPPIHAPPQHWSAIKTLRLSEVKVKDSMGFLQRGHLLLPILRCCPNLTSLDLSAGYALRTSLDDTATITFFELLQANFKRLRELTLGSWEFKFSEYEKTCARVGQIVRSCNDLRVLTMDRVIEERSGLAISLPCTYTFLHQLVNNLPRLCELSLCYYKIDGLELDVEAASRLASCLHDHWTSSARFKLKVFGLSARVEAAIQEALGREGVTVKVSEEYPRVFSVRRGYFLLS